MAKFKFNPFGEMFSQVPEVTPEVVNDLAVQGQLSFGDFTTITSTGTGILQATDRTFLEWKGGANWTVYGVFSDKTEGAVILLLNNSTNTSQITLKHNFYGVGDDDIYTSDEQDLILSKGDSAELVYKETGTGTGYYQVWRVNRAGDTVSTPTQIVGTGGKVTVESANMVAGAIGMVAGVGSFQVISAAAQGLIQVINNQLRISSIITNFRDFSTESTHTSSGFFSAIKHRVNMTNTGQTLTCNSGMQGYTGTVYKVGGQPFDIIGNTGVSILGFANGITLTNDGDVVSLKQISSNEFIVTGSSFNLDTQRA